MPNDVGVAQEKPQIDGCRQRNAAPSNFPPNKSLPPKEDRHKRDDTRSLKMRLREPTSHALVLNQSDNTNYAHGNVE